MPLIITVASVSMPALAQVCRYAEKNKDSGFDFRIHYLGGGDGEHKDCIEEDVRNADLLLTDLMGASRETYSKVVRSAKACKGQRLAIGGMAPSLSRLGGYDAASFRMNRADEENLHRIGECWKRAEYQDIDYIFTSVLKNYLGQDHLPDVPCSEAREGVYIKDPVTLKEYGSADDYFEDLGSVPGGGRVVLTYSGNSYPTRSIEAVRMLFERMREFVDVLPIAMNSYNIRYVPMMRSLIGTPDLIVNVLPFRFMAGPMGGDSVSATELLRELDAPYLSPFFLTKTTREEWGSRKAGTNPMEFMLYIFLPELDGALCTIPLGFNEAVGRLEGYDLPVTEIAPLEDRVDRIVGKVRSYMRLRTKPNSEKKVAIISYNYPPGEGNLFGGSFLDGSGSISLILDMLTSEGYSTKAMPPDEIIDSFVRNGTLNEGQWMSPTDRMITYDGGGKHPDQVSRAWGRPPGRIMTENGRYMIPGTVNGNVFIGLQPPRVPGSEDVSGSYHDPDLPPHHQYMAMYEWIRDVFKADAIVHLGTHGTLEFLPGKESAASSECYPDMMMGDSVHIYIYYSGNPSEAMIAKRKSHACLVSYMPPPFVKSGTYGDLVELEEAIAEYRESIKTDIGRSEALRESIERKASGMRLPADIEELEDELVSIRESLIPKGLHKFGKAFDKEDAESYAIHAMGFPHDGVVPLESLPELDAHDVERIYREYNSDRTVPDVIKDHTEAIRSLEYEHSLVLRASRSDELDGLRRALEGRFIDVKPGGDAMKDPEVLPSGYNIVQFNPDRVPTMAGFERGRQAAEDTISQYEEVAGSYPCSVALVLWGLETSRTQGMTVGQICWYLGLRLVRTSGDFASRFEVVPLEELGRPRIDVTVSMCGFFRDMFPNLVPGLSQLFSIVSSLDEPEDLNYCKAGTRRNREFLRSKGYSGNELDDLSECRLFGPPRGEYGTSMTGIVNRSSWKDEGELGSSFTESLRYAYTRSSQGYDAKGLLEVNHREVQVVSQVRDSADRELIDLDHYYEFLGGLSKAVEIARGGKRASVFVVDGSGSKVRTLGVRRSIERGVRTRLLNPKWIDGLLEVRYHGAQNINDRFENVLGLAATTGEVDSGVFSDMLKCYVEDQDMRRRVRENNNWAYMSMLSRLSEASSRGYWNATDKELELLNSAYMESEEMAEAETDRDS